MSKQPSNKIRPMPKEIGVVDLIDTTYRLTRSSARNLPLFSREVPRRRDGGVSLRAMTPAGLGFPSWHH